MYRTCYKNGHLKPCLQFCTLIILFELRFQPSISFTFLYFFFNAFNLPGILSIKSVIICGSILYHSCGVLSHNSWTSEGGLLYFASLLFKMDHKFSIGFISGICAGHFITEKFWFSSQVLIIFAVYLGSMSCWNTTSRSLSVLLEQPG